MSSGPFLSIYSMLISPEKVKILLIKVKIQEEGISGNAYTGTINNARHY